MTWIDPGQRCLDDAQHIPEILCLPIHGCDVVGAAFDCVEVSSDAAALQYMKLAIACGYFSKRWELAVRKLYSQ